MKHKKDISFILISTLFFAGCGAIGGMLACLLIAILAPLASLVVPIFIPPTAFYLVVITVVTVIGAVIGLVDGIRNSS